MIRPALALLLLAASTPALAQAQLPRTVVPVAYDITVEPDAQAMTFAGTGTIDVDVKQATSTIVLNAAELDISRASFDRQPAKFTLDPNAQTLTVTLPKPASLGRHTLDFTWSGKINTTAAGLFAIDYQDADGTKQRMLATQFEATDGRRFAPMWDEPSFKATFRLSAAAPAGQTAFSNMPAAEIVRKGAHTHYRFKPSPVMSSYLLYLGMGDVERKTVMAGNTEVGIITRKGVVDQGDYALAAAKDLLAYYNDYFGQPYPLPKLDMIAGPGSSQFFGAMENWGAIFYFEPTLLFDPDRDTISDKQRIYSIVAHEVAHQWFGNLVTMRWWDDLWLNEGFASWMEGKATADLNPQWQYVAASVATDRESAMRLDATAATHPVIRKIETIDQIGEAFDAITYAKGQGVITMLESVVGADTFRQGVRAYMAKYKWGNTQTEQLLHEISQAAGRDIAPFMRDFTLQGGVPLISVGRVSCAQGRTVAQLAQTRFGLDDASKAPQNWRVPVTLATLNGGTSSQEVRGAPAQKASVAGCGTLVANTGKGGYYRVRYDTAAHAAIVSDFAKLTVADQLGTLGDDLALGYSGDQDLARYFEAFEAVGVDADPLVWTALVGQMNRLATLYRGTPLGEKLNAKAIAAFAPVLERIGLEPRADDAPLVTNLRETLVAFLGNARDPRVAAAARRYVGALKADPAAIPPGIRTPVLDAYAASATAADWEALLAMARAERSPVVRNTYVELLGSAEDEQLARRALELVRGTEFTAPQRADLLAAVAREHPELAFDFATANAELVNGLTETGSRSSFIVGLAASSNDPATVAKVEGWAASNLPEGSRGPAERTVTTIRNRMAFADRLRPAVTRWTSR